MRKKLIVPAAAAVLAIAVSACAPPSPVTTGDGTASTTPSATVTATPSAMPSATASPAPQPGTAPAPGAAGAVPSVSTPPAPADPLAAAAWEALMSPEGEYAASAQYQAVIAEFGPVEPYVSIQAAEERHIDALTRQLERRGVTVPPNPYAGTIPAPADLEAAATAWAAWEVDNVALYDRLLDEVGGDQALTRVFSNLRSASQESHLPAFEAAAANGGRLTPEQMRDLGHR
ncbi:hypothetical protein [uncultured Kocuria sp.]|uniref:hypothetical protein n=1 Tax=uncultured Kocuria sp. TaxID=259305 RepID=UPI00262412C0|nr:hypothetical protein [uncultured Kocuria sp.]